MIFTLHMKPSDKEALDETRFDDLVAVPEGLAKWAILFAPFWLIFHGLWFALAVYALVTVFILALFSTALASIPLLLSGLPGLYLFLEGNQLRRSKLERDGYETVGVVDAEDEEAAIEKFLHKWQPVAVPPKPVPQTPFSSMKPAAPQPSFGLFAGNGS